MKVTIPLAISVLGTLGNAAMAQSAVTIFGIVDAGASRYTNNNANGSKSSQLVQSISGISTSRIGFRGTEDLGGGMSAGFWLEAALVNDTGVLGGSASNGGASTQTSVPAVFTRRSTISLSSRLGEIRLGRDYVPSFWNDTLFDPFGTNGVGSSNILASGNGAMFRKGLVGNNEYARASNAIGYVLPPNLRGWYGQVQYALSEAPKTGGTYSPKAGTTFGGRVGYSSGPLDVAFAYGETRLYDTETEVVTAKIFNVGASHDFGPVKLMAELSKVRDKDEIRSQRLTNTNEINGFLLGFTAPAGAGLIKVAYSRVAVHLDGASSTASSDPRSSKFALGYVHNLSKRTALYASSAHISNKGNISVSTSSPAMSLKSDIRRSSGYDFGVRHVF